MLTAVTFALAATALLALIVTLCAAPLDALRLPAARQKLERSHERWPPLLTLVLVAAALIQASHVLVLNFGSIHWARAGGVLARRRHFFSLIERWVNGPEKAASLMVLGGGVALARWLLMAFDPNNAMLALAQAGHGFSFAATHVGTMLLIADLAPTQMGSRARLDGRRRFCCQRRSDCVLRADHRQPGRISLFCHGRLRRAGVGANSCSKRVSGGARRSR
jgi:MFS transporter, PPP family, 3-phenylpropionic acid transporter